MEKQHKKRKSNFELLRSILMILIIAHHYVVTSDLPDIIKANQSLFRSQFLVLFGAWGKTAINVFILITGYFMWNSRISLKKYIKLLGEYEFYKISIYVILYYINSHYFTVNNPFTLQEFLHKVNPYYAVSSSYVPAYFILYLFIPFINSFIKEIDRKKHVLCICLCVFVYSILGSIKTIKFSFNYVSWFIVLYIIGAFFGKYSERHALFNKHIGIKMLLSILLASASVIILMLNGGSKYYWVADSNKILSLTVAVFVFLFFENYRFHILKLLMILVVLL